MATSKTRTRQASPYANQYVFIGHDGLHADRLFYEAISGETAAEQVSDKDSGTSPASQARSDSEQPIADFVGIDPNKLDRERPVLLDTIGGCAS